MTYKPFPQPIYVTRPILPDISRLNVKLQEIWGVQWLTNNGMQVRVLEERLNRILKVPHISLFNNGTTALMVACKTLNLSGSVITTPYTFAATVHALSWLGIEPIFCDVDPHTGNIDPSKIEALIRKNTTGILAVHVFGTPCNISAIQKIADKANLKVIYDAAHAFMCEIKGKSIGNYGDATMFSFHATKLFHTVEGGALAFKNSPLKQDADLRKNFGIEKEDEIVLPGINGKMNEIQAAMGLCVLDMIQEEREKRRAIFNLYKKELKKTPGISIIEAPSNVTPSYQYMVIRINSKESRDFIHSRLKHYNIITRKYFPLCNEFPCYRNFPSSSKENLPNAHKIAGEALALPFYGGLKEEEVIKICDILKSELQ